MCIERKGKNMEENRDLRKIEIQKQSKQYDYNKFTVNGGYKAQALNIFLHTQSYAYEFEISKYGLHE